ncbi:MAG: tRNA (adenosine(37)-N6)-dimethylallyltransferase MiaA [Cyclobacteriaceae bacterium]
MSKEKHLIVVVGPTAIGKTALAVELAKTYGAVVVSADSRQFYKELAIGTAKPTTEEMDGVTHHFIDSHSVQQEYTAGMYEHDCIELLNELFQKHQVVVLVGGSGLFIRAVCEGLDNIPGDKVIREQLIQEYEEKGLEDLQDRLKTIDPIHYAQMDTANPHRVMRALEACLVTGKPFSELRTGEKKKRSFTITTIGLEMERELLYDRINRRVDSMLENGLLDEVKTILPFQELTALQTVGYREFYPYFKQERSLEESVELVKRNTRRYAKQQMTWFKKSKDTVWFEAGNHQLIQTFLETKIKTE